MHETDSAGVIHGSNSRKLCCFGFEVLLLTKSLFEWLNAEC